MDFEVFLFIVFFYAAEFLLNFSFLFYIIFSATAIWMINEILTTSDTTIRSIVDSVTWYIVPVVNVDGMLTMSEKYFLSS